MFDGAAAGIMNGVHDSLPRTGHTPGPTPASLGSPAALRASRPSWRDPRLVLGLVLLCTSVLAGARILDGADETVEVVAVRAPLAAGQVIEPSELTTVRLRFADEADADRYLPGGSDLGDVVALRPLGAGELLPRDAVGKGGTDVLTELPLTLRAGRVPAAVRVGSSVDVWAAAPLRESTGATEQSGAELLLSDVPVLASGRSAGAVGGGLRQVVVGVPETAEPQMARVVARLSEDALLLVRRPG